MRPEFYRSAIQSDGICRAFVWFMENQDKTQGKDTKSTQPDKNLAAGQRPVPSQAEGDRKTIDEDLESKDDTGRKGA